YISKKLRLSYKEENGRWVEFVNRLKSLREDVAIAIVGKYVDVRDAYLSIREALRHAGVENGCRVNCIWVDCEDLEKIGDVVFEVDGILVPGGFGKRGAEGKIRAIKYARENNIPFLGICFGFQLAIVEFARNVAGIKDANSSEIAETENPVIDLLPEQRGVKELGGTMRLGEEKIILKPGTVAHRLYRKEVIYERHRHRYEVNSSYISLLERQGLVFSGFSESNLAEIIELPSHRFFFATQFHPEFKSRPLSPSPAFLGFVKAALDYKKSKNKN
ncbi:MAG: CTP synthase, partial [Archaeoglobaceae archaeon]